MRLIDADVLLEPIVDCAIAVEDGDSIELRDCDKCPCNILDCEDFEKAINAAPTVNPVKWIPVTERLPEKPGKYLVTVRNGNVYAGTYSAYEGRFQCAAVAWMELPEPYEEGGR